MGSEVEDNKVKQGHLEEIRPIRLIWNGNSFPESCILLREMKWHWTSKAYIAHYFGGYPLRNPQGEVDSYLFMYGDVEVKTGLVSFEEEDGTSCLVKANGTPEDVAEAVIYALRGMDRSSCRRCRLMEHKGTEIICEYYKKGDLNA